MAENPVVSVRLDGETAAQLRDLANERGTTISELLRQGAVAAMNEHNSMKLTWLGAPTVSIGNTATFTAPAPPPTLAQRIAADILPVVLAELDKVRAEVAEGIAQAIEATMEGYPLGDPGRAAYWVAARIARGYTAPASQPGQDRKDGTE